MSVKGSDVVQQVSEAKEMCRGIVKEKFAEYLCILKDNRNNMGLSLIYDDDSKPFSTH